MRHLFRGRNARWCAALLTVVAIPASIVIRHDRTDDEHQRLAEAFDCVGRLTNGGSGTLIASSWVLTAAHCLMFGDAFSFEVVGESIAADAWYLHPHALPAESSIDGENDVALLHLATPVPGVEPAAMLDADPQSGVELAQVATLVGFGLSGSGTEGAIVPAGTKRAGHNVVDAIGGTVGAVTWCSTVLLLDFDAPESINADSRYPNRLGDASPLDLECGMATGDSGGALFLDWDDEPRLAGVLSGVSGDRMHVKSGGPDNHYGVYNRVTRVCSFVPWLKHAMNLVEHPDDAALRNLVSVHQSVGENGKVEIVFRRTGDTTFPLRVFWTLGGTARRQSLLDPKDAVSDYALRHPSSNALMSTFAVIPEGESEATIMLVPAERGGEVQAVKCMELELASNALYRIETLTSIRVEF